MDWQQAASLSLVAGAAFFLVRSVLQRPGKPGSGSCASCPQMSHHSQSAESIVFRARRGRRPEIIVRQNRGALAPSVPMK